VCGQIHICGEMVSSRSVPQRIEADLCTNSDLALFHSAPVYGGCRSSSHATGWLIHLSSQHAGRIHTGQLNPRYILQLRVFYTTPSPFLRSIESSPSIRPPLYQPLPFRSSPDPRTKPAINNRYYLSLVYMHAVFRERTYVPLVFRSFHRSIQIWFQYVVRS
jgi:hypothetical protein